MRQIPFGKPMIDDCERQAVMDVMRGDILVHGSKVKEFEKVFAALTGAPQAVSVSSCTAALHLLYFYLGLKAGDEVIVPAQTHIATAHAVELTGAKPVFVDAEKETGNIDINQIEKAITSRTRAISIVHFLGMPVAMDRVSAIAMNHGLFLVEDAALAIGTYYKGVHAGLLGNAGCFSFYPVKHFTTAEGGAIITKDAVIAAKLERQKAFGVDRIVGERKVPGVYDVTMLGFNYRMNEIEAAIGIEQVKKVPMLLSRRKANYECLKGLLRDITEIEFLRSSYGEFQSSYYCLSVILKNKLVSKRFEIVDELKVHGIGTSVYYPRPVPHMTYYRDKYGYERDSFPVAALISYSSIALSVGPHLNEEDMRYVAEVFKKAIIKFK